MSKHIVWASGANELDCLAPTAEKQAQGWVTENPPHEWFNWHMNRTDSRLEDLESPTKNTIFTLYAHERTETIKAGQRFSLPLDYIVGTGALHVYIDGLLCEPGADLQYVECGEQYSLSNYIRFNDDIDAEYDIRVEIPIKAQEPAVYADEVLVGTVNELKEKVANLAEPTYTAKLDSPANSRGSVLRAGEIFTFEVEYIVGTDILQVFRNGVLLYAGTDYNEIGSPGEKSTDIAFTFDLPVEDAIRAYIAMRTGDTHTVLAESVSLRTIGEKVAYFTREHRVDKVTERRIEAMTDYTVPEYRVGSGTLRVYRDGLLLSPDRDYSENNEPGSISTKIVWSASVPEGSLITVIAPTVIPGVE